jgi:hypothetical protein
MSTPITSRTVSNLAALGFLTKTYGWDETRAARVLAIATMCDPTGKAEPTEGGFVQVIRKGDEYLVEDHTGRDIS